MFLQSRRAVVGVDIEGELGQPGKIWLGHLAAHRQHEAVISVGCAVRGADGRRRRIDLGDVGGDMPDARGIEQLPQRDSARAEVGFVVADPDVVEGLRTDDGDVDVALRSAELVEPSRGAECSPQSGEPGPQNEDTFRRRHGSIVTCHRSGDKGVVSKRQYRRAMRPAALEIAVRLGGVLEVVALTGRHGRPFPPTIASNNSPARQANSS